MQAPWPAVETLIPHRAPMLLVRQVVGLDGEEGGTCLGVVDEASPFVADGAASPVFGLELAAQSAAALAALAALGRGGEASPRVGYLAAVSNAHFHVPELPAGRPLLATVRWTRRTPSLALCQVTVTLQASSEELVTATLSVAQSAAS